MLPAVHRLLRADDFRAALRTGVRVGSPLLVVHLHAFRDDDPARPARIGFVVSKAVGPAVVRNRVKRRLRHQVRARLDQLHPGCVYVVRANPAAAAATAAELGTALDRCLARLEKTPGRGGDR